MDGNGTVDLVEAYYDKDMGKVMPELALDAISRGLPEIRQRVKTHKEYGEASVEEIFGEGLKKMKLLEANWLETTVFLNRGDHFEAKALPRRRSLRRPLEYRLVILTVMGMRTFFWRRIFLRQVQEASRYDAGRGLWLRGDGAGNFTAVSGQESGVKVYGDRGVVPWRTMIMTGRVDLVVSQNGTTTKLYHNVGARPGYRVRLNGAGTNPAGVGAAIWLFFGEKGGAMREVHAGSGYWSQDSAVQVMGAAQPAAKFGCAGRGVKPC